MLKQEVLLCAMLAVVLSGTIPEKDNHTGCYIKEIDVVIPNNQTYRSAGSPKTAGCREYHCFRGEHYTTIMSGKCVQYNTQRYKEVEGDLSKPYPDCCPKPVAIENGDLIGVMSLYTESLE